MKSIPEIKEDLYNVCYDVERKVRGHTPKRAAFWAKSDSLRHAHTLEAVLDHSAKTGNTCARILNASVLRRPTGTERSRGAA